MQIENLDRLGLVAGMIDELGLVELSNEQIEPRLIIRLFGPPLSGITTHLVNHLSTCGMEAPTLKNTLFYGSSGVSWKQVEPL